MQQEKQPKILIVQVLDAPDLNCSANWPPSHGHTPAMQCSLTTAAARQPRGVGFSTLSGDARLPHG
jgi:hypothetical protein